jgi:hypothetical protein
MVGAHENLKGDIMISIAGSAAVGGIASLIGYLLMKKIRK